MRTRQRRLVVAVVLAATVSLVTAAVVPPEGDARSSPRDADSVRLVPVGADEESRLWPFTGRERAFDSLTLPVNVVVEGDPGRVRALLVTGRDARWGPEQAEWQGVAPERAAAVPADDDLPWRSATGAVRYVYVDTPGPGGRWLDETLQLHDGTYFGSRHHLRLYGAPPGAGRWTAIQAHRDYWDWFRLRHTVTSLAGPQHTVERQLRGRQAVVGVTRERFANGGIRDADGWVTVVALREQRQVRRHGPLAGQGGPGVGTPDALRATDGTEGDPGTSPRLLAAALAVVSLVGAAVVARRLGSAGSTSPAGRYSTLGGALSARLRARGGATLERLRWSRVADRRVHLLAAFAVALLCLPSLIRATSLALEAVLPRQPKVVAALLYPVFAFGPPTLALTVPRRMTPEPWAVAAVGAYGVGLVVDLLGIGVTTLPVTLVVHRALVVVTLGALAAAGWGRRHPDGPGRAGRTLAVGAWLALLAWPLVGSL
ncbi:hypothetical protein [Salinirubrum litoreum]|uniref:Uncharacterized protein n=1 Tax=Salinirubrum litoreum TaxID=1126234 RepID=A0ABD5RC50_9EURY|nr:hypothetical protein [Salinirubrum litoreum]